MKPFLFFLSFSMISFLNLGTCSAQTQFQNWIGGPRQDQATGIIPTPDGGFLLIGNTQSYGLGEAKIKKEVIKDQRSDILLVKLDSLCEVEWTRTLGSTESEYGVDICPARGGEYWIIGKQEKETRESISTSIVTAKVDQHGNLLVSKVFSGRGNDLIHSLSPTLDGGFLLTGTTSSHNPGGIRGESKIWIARMEESGTISWAKTVGGGGAFWGTKGVQLPGGGYIISGTMHLPNTDFNEPLLFRLDERGNLSWLWRYKGPLDLTVTDLHLNPDGSILLLGNTRRFRDAGIGDPFVLKTDERGNPQWVKTYSGPALDRAVGLRESPSGSLLIYGATHSFALGATDGFAYQISQEGALEWAHSYGGRERETINGAATSANGSWLFAGKTETFGEGIHEVYLIGTDEKGNAGCLTESCPVEVRALEGLEKQALLLSITSGTLPEIGTLNQSVAEIQSGPVCRPKKKR